MGGITALKTANHLKRCTGTTKEQKAIVDQALRTLRPNTRNCAGTSNAAVLRFVTVIARFDAAPSTGAPLPATHEDANGESDEDDTARLSGTDEDDAAPLPDTNEDNTAPLPSTYDTELPMLPPATALKRKSYIVLSDDDDDKKEALLPTPLLLPPPAHSHRKRKTTSITASNTNTTTRRRMATILPLQWYTSLRALRASHVRRLLRINLRKGLKMRR